MNGFDEGGATWGFGGLLRRLRGSPTHKDDPEPTPADESREAPGEAIRAELARLASRILASRGDGARRDGPAAELNQLAEKLARRDGGHGSDRLPGLAKVETVFRLKPVERDLLFLAAAVEVDPMAARLVGLLNDHIGRPRPTLGIVADLGGDPTEIAGRIGTGGALQRFVLARLEGEGPLSTRAVTVPADLWPLLLGFERAPPFPVAELPAWRFADLALPEDMPPALDHVAEAVASRTEAEALLAIAGDPGTGRRDIAAVFAQRSRQSAISVSGADLPDDAAVATLLREAVLADAAIILNAPETMPPAIWRLLTARAGTMLIVVTEPRHLSRLALDASRPIVEVEAPRRDLQQRLRMWTAHAPADWPDHDLRALAERFNIGAGEITSALRLARARAGADGRNWPEPADARHACETLRETRFDGAAERLECPYAPNDIVLRRNTKAELDLTVAWARHGARLFARGGSAEGLGAGGGLACLFSGPPGTGKTMAAQIIARQVDYALYRIDLSQVVDKFIGESEKRLSALFDEAERSRVALFFDEADALFGKRTEVRDSHDRYANITVDHLLQRLDSFDGLAILATNLVGNIDDAFLRRVRIRAEFHPPDAGDRRQIWERLLPSQDDRSSDIDIALLADPFELVGGEIRNAVYTAHLLAADEGEKLAMRHCISGLWRELGKIGRVPDKAHLGRWRRVVER